MNQIALDNTLPQVFLQRTDIESDIWRKRVSLEKGKTYLIEAQSGTGKSSLCSFIIGYRKDYDGSILFDGKDSRKLAKHRRLDNAPPAPHQYAFPRASPLPRTDGN